MDTVAHHDARIPHLFLSEGPMNPHAMKCNATLPLRWKKGRTASSRARRGNSACSRRSPPYCEHRGEEHGRSWTESDDGAGWHTKGHAGCAWQQNNWRGIAAPASNCFGIVWNHVHLELHCHGVHISTIAYPDLINSHYPVQALDHFCTQRGPQSQAQQHQPFTELQLIQSRWGILQD